MWEWLSKKTNREIAAIVIPLVGAGVAGAWAVYTYVDSKKVLSIVASYHVCNAPPQIPCSSLTAIRIAPGASIAEWAKKECNFYKMDNKVGPEEKHWWSEAEVKCEVTAR